ncbi:hypothetical protein QBC35DRAFT_463144 [Podospora australis]|uniref:Uncharacterized protein n=1 Tax=Podospora australis TaxID=1536484 RepID=A0AAN6WVR9_9PEZI|nr:hypothetical protein QBC35DRAFT_463144 [Podospora australis]
MGGKVWNKEEETYFWHVLIPHTDKRLGDDIEKNREKGFDWVANQMKEWWGRTQPGIELRRDYSSGACYEHYYRLAVQGHNYGNIGNSKLVKKYHLHELEAKKNKIKQDEHKAARAKANARHKAEEAKRKKAPAARDEDKEVATKENAHSSDSVDDVDQDCNRYRDSEGPGTSSAADASIPDQRHRNTLSGSKTKARTGVYGKRREAAHAIAVRDVQSHGAPTESTSDQLAPAEPTMPSHRLPIGNLYPSENLGEPGMMRQRPLNPESEGYQYQQQASHLPSHIPGTATNQQTGLLPLPSLFTTKTHQVPSHGFGLPPGVPSALASQSSLPSLQSSGPFLVYSNGYEMRDNTDYSVHSHRNMNRPGNYANDSVPHVLNNFDHGEGYHRQHPALLRPENTYGSFQNTRSSVIEQSQGQNPYQRQGYSSFDPSRYTNVGIYDNSNQSSFGHNDDQAYNDGANIPTMGSDHVPLTQDDHHSPLSDGDQ